MAGYQITIKNNEETITLSTKEASDKPDVTSVVYKMNTLDDSTRNRADAIRLEFKICGTITESNRDETKKLAKWAMDANKKTLYRSVAMEVYDSKNCTGEILRIYEADNMFVIDYQELFENSENNSGGDADSGVFELWIAQKEGNDKKEVFSS